MSMSDNGALLALGAAGLLAGGAVLRSRSGGLSYYELSEQQQQEVRRVALQQSLLRFTGLKGAKRKAALRKLKRQSTRALTLALHRAREQRGPTPYTVRWARRLVKAQLLKSGQYRDSREAHAVANRSVNVKDNELRASSEAGLPNDPDFWDRVGRAMNMEEIAGYWDEGWGYISWTTD